MFRKIHSKKPPGATLGAELQKEFGRYFARAGFAFRKILSRYPFAAFSLMVVSMLLSGILAFTVMRQKKPAPFPKMPAVKSSPAVLTPGSVAAYEAFKEAGILQSQIEAIARKDSVNPQDSIAVIKALQRIDAIRQQFKPQH